MSARIAHNILAGTWGEHRKSQLKRDMTGVRTQGWQVTKRARDVTKSTCWELKCDLCGATRTAQTREIVGAVEGRSKLRECECITAIPTAEWADKHFDLEPMHYCYLVAVLAHERLYGFGPLRLDLEKLFKRVVDTSPLVKKGYLIAEGHPKRLSGTEKAWKKTGETKESETKWAV